MASSPNGTPTEAARMRQSRGRRGAIVSLADNDGLAGVNLQFVGVPSAAGAEERVALVDSVVDDLESEKPLILPRAVSTRSLALIDDPDDTHLAKPTATPRSAAAAAAAGDPGKPKFTADSHFVVAGKTQRGPQHSFRDNLDFLRTDQYGSRAVGGQKPLDEALYWKIEAVDYLVPDTKQEEENERAYTPPKRNRRRLFLWVLYAILGVVTAVVIFYTLVICDFITKERAYATKKLLKKNEIGMAWLVWTGSSIVLCVIA